MCINQPKMMNPTAPESSPAKVQSGLKGRHLPAEISIAKENQTEIPKDGIHFSITHLTEKLSIYLSASDLTNIKDAFRFADEMHLGQMRRSGEPYISHPIAVAVICADWKLDAQAIMAALLSPPIPTWQAFAIIRNSSGERRVASDERGRAGRSCAECFG